MLDALCKDTAFLTRETVINASEYNTKKRKTNKIKQIMKVQGIAHRTLFPDSLTEKYYKFYRQERIKLEKSTNYRQTYHDTY